MKYIVIAILYCVIAGIVAGIALRNHDKEKEDLEDVTKAEMVIVIICAIPLWFVVIVFGLPMSMTYTWMHEVCKK